MKNRALPSKAGFTLFEVIMALMILGLISGAVYSISSAALETTKATFAAQSGVRRLEAFLEVTRDAFLSLPADAAVSLRMVKSQSGAPIPEVVFEEATGVFGMPSLGGGSLILAARPKADGTRTFSILLVPGNVQGIEADRFMSQGAWIPLLPKVERVRWSFFNAGEWKEEWPQGTGRPQAVRLQFEYLELPGSPIDVHFWIPPLARPAESTPVPSPAQPTPTPNNGTPK